VSAEIQNIARACRVFLSMPFVEGLTPRILRDGGGAEVHPTGEPFARRHGIFCADEVGLSVFDHGALYGDSVFEGLLVVGGRLFTWREHLARLLSGARRLGIEVPYGPVDLSLQVLRTIREAGVGGSAERGYVRLVVTRGLGDLGIHPARCLGSTVFAIAARIQLYPEELYEKGIGLSIARGIRRPGPDVLDPNIKASNYLNNIMALLETLAERLPETLMLTQQGHVAEATADNLFLVVRGEGWEGDPGRIVLRTPSVTSCLEGITRAVVLGAAADLGYRTQEAADLLPSDLVGADREVFLTGTGAGLIPVIAVGGQAVGDGRPGPVTRELRRRLLAAQSDPELGLPAGANRAEIESYLARPSTLRAATFDLTVPSGGR
jgi:branched-chain amino acid aminotransferase